MPAGYRDSNNELTANVITTLQVKFKQRSQRGSEPPSEVSSVISEPTFYGRARRPRGDPLATPTRRADDTDSLHSDLSDVGECACSAASAEAL